jgi:hypothetical protein
MAEQEEEGGGSSFPNSNSNDDNDQEQNDGGAPKGSLEDELVKQYCIEHFSSKDYIMEPRVIDTLMTYFTAGGQPEMVVKCLSENYQGLESYANLLGRWLSDLGGDSSMISAAAAGERKWVIYS